MNMSRPTFRKSDYGRFSMNLAVGTMEQERLQGWLNVASADTGECFTLCAAPQKEILYVFECLCSFGLSVVHSAVVLISLHFARTYITKLGPHLATSSIALSFRVNGARFLA